VRTQRHPEGEPCEREGSGRGKGPPAQILPLVPRVRMTVWGLSLSEKPCRLNEKGLPLNGKGLSLSGRGSPRTELLGLRTVLRNRGIRVKSGTSSKPESKLSPPLGNCGSPLCGSPATSPRRFSRAYLGEARKASGGPTRKPRSGALGPAPRCLPALRRPRQAPVADSYEKRSPSWELRSNCSERDRRRRRSATGGRRHRAARGGLRPEAAPCLMQTIAGTIQIAGRARDETGCRQERPETQEPDP
jgi:hypothetical protein